MSQPRCLLRNLSPASPLPARSTVFQATSKHDVHIANLRDTPTGYLAILADDHDLEKLLTPKLTEALRDVNLSPTPPIDLTSKRTLFIRGVEEELGCLPFDDLNLALIDNNPDLEIDTVIKIPNRDCFFKVKFSNSRSDLFVDFQKIPQGNHAPNPGPSRNLLQGLHAG